MAGTIRSSSCSTSSRTGRGREGELEWMAGTRRSQFLSVRIGVSFAAWAALEKGSRSERQARLQGVHKIVSRFWGKLTARFDFFSFSVRSFGQPTLLRPHAGRASAARGVAGNGRRACRLPPLAQTGSFAATSGAHAVGRGRPRKCTDSAEVAEDRMDNSAPGRSRGLSDPWCSHPPAGEYSGHGFLRCWIGRALCFVQIR
jgi:hypothetical protein